MSIDLETSNKENKAASPQDQKMLIRCIAHETVPNQLLQYGYHHLRSSFSYTSISTPFHILPSPHPLIAPRLALQFPHLKQLNPLNVNRNGARWTPCLSTVTPPSIGERKR